MLSRRTFMKWGGAAAAGAAVGSLGIRRARGAYAWKAEHVVIVSIAGGLRKQEALGMEWGATMPNLFGNVPLMEGFGSDPRPPAMIAPEYMDLQPGALVLPPPRSMPLFTEGALVTNLRYAEGAPGHLQGAACLVSGAYNNIENSVDAHAPAPTLFELHRRASNAPATDAWYVSNPGGFYRTLQLSEHADFGAKYAGSWLSPPGGISSILPLLTSGERGLTLDAKLKLPVIPYDPDEANAVRKLAAVLDAGHPALELEPFTWLPTSGESADFEAHLAPFFADPTYQAFYPDAMGIGLDFGDGNLRATPDATTTYHAERLLARFKPSVMVMSLLDIDAAHDDFNGYLRGQQLADALVTHLWEFIESTEGLAGKTALFIVPEHGRQLFFNGNNPDSLGRAGVDHGIGDDGDREVWLMALGPDFQPGVFEPTGVSQTGRASARYETIDATMTAAAILGRDEDMTTYLEDGDFRPGLLIEDILK
jgi:TAT (twin-arginine translocation) pathway-exported protein